MKNEVSIVDLKSLIMSAQNCVRIIGVTLLDLDWTDIIGKIAEKRGFHFHCLIESDNTLFSKSFTSDTSTASRRRSYESLKFARDQMVEDFDLAKGKNPVFFAENSVYIKTIHLPLPLAIVEIDGSYYCSPWLQEPIASYILISEHEPWWQHIKKYIESYFSDQEGGRYTSDFGAELLELFDHKRHPRGIYPRGSFYDTDYSQLVVWALIFDRKGRVLIHRREENAKDNQGMWDKSVGGHVDFSIDTDTSRAVLREAIEELFTDENKHESTELSPWQVNDQDVIFMGEWRPDRRKRLPFKEISSLNKEWVFFRTRDSQHVYSPRTLPNGNIRRLRVIADVFLFIAGPGFSDKSIATLKNSEYKLIELSDLKSVMDKALKGQDVFSDGQPFDRVKSIPSFTPDLVNIMTGDLRSVLEEFSEYIKSQL
jgi:NUDIX domain